MKKTLVAFVITMFAATAFANEGTPAATTQAPAAGSQKSVVVQKAKKKKKAGKKSKKAKKAEAAHESAPAADAAAPAAPAGDAPAGH